MTDGWGAQLGAPARAGPAARAQRITSCTAIRSAPHALRTPGTSLAGGGQYSRVRERGGAARRWRACAEPTLSMTIGLMSPAAYLTSASAKLPSRKARPTFSLASRMFFSRARSRIDSASAFFLSSEWPFLAPVSFTFMTCRFWRVGKTGKRAAAMVNAQWAPQGPACDAAQRWGVSRGASSTASHGTYQTL